jgi:DNA-binding XRE family transcriptional regulator
MPTDFSDYVASVEEEASPEQRAVLDAYTTHYEHETRRLLDLSCALVAARMREGLTQKQLSKIADVQQSEISRIEHGRGNPTIDTLIKIAAPLHAHLALVDDDGRVLTA